MNESSIVVRGILHPDGTLELAERPTLPAGNVEVTIRPVASVTVAENWLESLLSIRAEREASGYPFRTKEEIDSQMAEDRDWGEDRLDAIRAQAESEKLTLPSEPTDLTSEAETCKVRAKALWELMERSRAEMEASGHQFQSKEEIDAYIEDLRDWDGKLDDVYRQLEEEHRRADPK